MASTNGTAKATTLTPQDAFVEYGSKYGHLRVNQSRIVESIHTGCQWGEAHRYGKGPHDTGMARLSLNEADGHVRRWFVQETEKLGCEVTIDKMGNIFAIRPGKKKNGKRNQGSAPPIVAGSHLDTQPAGGRYDGILGVNAGLEMLRVLVENEVETEGPVGVVDWTNEEGARFPMMMVSSGVWAESIPLETAWNLKEISTGEDGGGGGSERKNMKQELERLGFLGEKNCSYKEMPIAAHFEVHIEQGPVLERENRKIGVVDGVQAFKWFEITVHGMGKHTGTTPLAARSDALLCASKLIIRSNEIAKAHSGLCSTGVLSISPSSINTFASTCTFTLDMRHPSDSALEAMESACRADFARIATHESESGCRLVWKLLTPSPAVNFHPDCIAAVEASARDVLRDHHDRDDDDGGKAEGLGNPIMEEEAAAAAAKEGPRLLWKHMTSGAGHDSCYTNQRVPTSMIFTPCKDGISHNPEEYCSPEDCALGAQVLLGAVLRYDQLRAMRGDFDFDV